MLVTDQHDFVAPQHLRQEVMALGDCGRELSGWIPNGIAFTTDRLLGIACRLNYLGERSVTKDHEVDVAVRALLPTGGRSVDERCLDAIPQWFQGVSNRLGCTQALGYDAMEIVIDRT